MQNELNAKLTYKIVVICDYDGTQWEKVVSENIITGDEISILLKGFKIDEYKQVSSKKKWWEFWK